MKTKFSIVSFLLLISLIFVLAAACQAEKNTSEVTTNSVDQVSPGSENNQDEPVIIERTYSDPHEILIMLQEMERIRKDHWQAHQGWWHAQKMIKSQSGNLHGAYGEWWFRFNESQSCPEMLQIIYQEDGQVLEASVIIPESSLADEEIPPEPPAQENKVILVKVPDQSCPDLLDLTLNHVEQVLNHPNKNTFESVEAHVRDGYLYITLTQKDVIQDVLSVTIDLTTGFLAGAENQIYITDENKLEGEVEYRYTYEIVDQLPVEIEDQFKLAFMEY
jgi:hypothetical protein